MFPSFIFSYNRSQIDVLVQFNALDMFTFPYLMQNLNQQETIN